MLVGSAIRCVTTAALECANGMVALECVNGSTGVLVGWTVSQFSFVVVTTCCAAGSILYVPSVEGRAYRARVAGSICAQLQ